MSIKKILKLIVKTIVTLSVLSCIFMSLVFYCNLKPFKSLRTLWVTTAMTTFTHHWLATSFISQTEINRILNENKVVTTSEKTDVKDIKINSSASSSTSITRVASSSVSSFSSSDQITVIDINQNNYAGKLMIVDNPSRIELGIINKFGSNYGLKLSALAEKNDAVAAINSSAFVDPSGSGNGGTPMGIVVKNGKILYTDGSSSYTLVGFDFDHRLVTGQFTVDDIAKNNIKDAVSFGPSLIINGNAVGIVGDGGSGLQPRTAIGQTVDGKVLLLVIDGRQPIHSLGASIKDIQSILLQYGAINACNLDGGSSAGMYYDGELITKPCGPLGNSGGRYIPTSFIVK